VIAVAAAAIVTAANASQGAYFSQSWGWVALAFLVPTTLLLVLDRTTVPGRLRIVFVVLMATFAAWIATSAVWSSGVSAPLREGERILAYLALSLAVAVILRRGDGPAVVGGLISGVALVASYSISTRLLPDVLETYATPGLPYRLSTPVGYWNGLGLLVAMGFVMTFGVVAHARRTEFALAAAATMPILACTLYFTFSRGAYAAQVFGYAAMVAFDPRRLRLLWVSAVVSVPSLIAAGYAAKQGALTTEGSAPGVAAAQGHRVVAVLLGTAMCSIALAWAARHVARRVPAPKRARRAVNGVLIAVLMVAVLAAVVRAGGPVHGARALKSRFDAPNYSGSDLNSRLLSFSGSGRGGQIRIAIDAGRAHPVRGTGAGSYESLWYLHRRDAYVIRDAHSLYAETFGELGVVGLTVLLLLLSLPLVAMLGARRSHLVPVTAGGYLAWAAHSSLDWNWELVGVTMVAFLAGGAAFVSSERARTRLLPSAVRLPLACLGVVLTLAALVSLVGNQALFAGRNDVVRAKWTDALGNARKARTLLPWSYEPYVVYGDAAAGLGDRPGAITAYRRALDRAPDNWVVWLRLAEVARGQQSVRAYRRVHQLNPLEQGLPDYVYRKRP